jgi:hypothetical protein
VPQLTVEGYVTSRYILKPRRIWDCDRPVQATAAYLFTTAERARDLRQQPIYILNHTQHEARQRSTQASLDEIEAETDRVALMMWEGSGLGPYDGYSIMTQFWLEAFQWHGVKRGKAYAFYAGDISVGGPHAFNSSAGNLGNGRPRTALWTDCIEQLHGTAGPRQVRVRAETALAGFGPSLGGGWIMFGQYPS